ncbi:putative glycosyltransferase EpsJ [Emticicia aquatica]|uniref:Glycosyltransferase EpsJ n=1 Tax=Emticicia aquatica TaxID=1681835 RepID=A0ABM9AV51_9BACT|nr:glycosyltransferase family A protein [Emticicia aquatica]CAH0997923.1 putative glycosyltransferase EpsJ [Emticicia aquatica]
MHPTPISVIIPAFNASNYIKRALDSVFSQSVLPKEVIVIDDGSTDNTATIVKAYGNVVSYIYQTNLGPSSARNAGIKAANENIIAFLDADDYWPKNKLETQLAILEKDTSLDVVWGRVKIDYKHEGIEKFTREGVSDDSVFITCLGAALFRKNVFNEVGLFNENLKTCEDWDWYIRAMDKKVSINKIPEIGLFYCRHDDNLTKDLQDLTKQSIQLLKLTINRRRQNTNHE